METLGKRISENRKAKNIKQDELAEMLLVSPQAVSKWENDISCPDISLLPKLSEILGISVDELLSGKKENAAVFVPEERAACRPMPGSLLSFYRNSDFYSAHSPAICTNFPNIQNSLLLPGFPVL